VRYVVAIHSDNNNDDDDYDGTDYGGDGDDHDERWTIYTDKCSLTSVSMIIMIR